MEYTTTEHRNVNQRLLAQDSQVEMLKKILEESRKEIATLRDNMSSLQEQYKNLKENKTKPEMGVTPLEGMIDANRGHSEFTSAGCSNSGFDEESSICSSNEIQQSDLGLSEMELKKAVKCGRSIEESLLKVHLFMQILNNIKGFTNSLLSQKRKRFTY